MTAVLTRSPNKTTTLDLSDLRKRYPLTVTNLGSLPDREVWLRKILNMEAQWKQKLADGDPSQEVIVRGAPPSDLQICGEFDIVYAGGVVGLLHASVMASRYKRKVLVFDPEVVGKTEREWNVSDDDLQGLERTGLFTNEEIRASIINRYRSGFVKFHDASSRVKAPPLWMDRVMNVAIDADKLLQLALKKIQDSETGSISQSGSKFVRCWVTRNRVVVEVEDQRTRERQGFAARLFVDAVGSESRVFRDLNNGMPVTHVSPTVGTVARGFASGEGPDAIDFSVGEILVSTEDAKDHRQLIWEGFAGDPRKDEYATYLFFYDAVDSAADKSLFGLFEHYFETLPNYKRKGAQWRVVKPVFDYVSGNKVTGRSPRRVTATDRVMVIAEAAGPSNLLAFSDFGSRLRNLQKVTTLTNTALVEDSLDGASLRSVSTPDRRVADVANLAELLRPTEKSAPSSVNESLNALMGALHSLDERVRRELFQDRITFNALKDILGRTARLYPHILERLREHLGVRGSFWWLVNIAEASWKERRDRKSLEDVEQDDGTPRMGV
jgi:lycopene cyclase CruA